MADEIEDGGALTGSTDRRDLLKKAAIGGAVAWAVPSVISLSSAAAASGPGCHGSATTNWDLVGGAITTVNGPVPSNPPWNGTNIDVVFPGFAGTPTWTSTQYWVDVVGNNNNGSLAGSFNNTCGVPTLVTVAFTYSEYNVASTTTIRIIIGPYDSGVLPVSGTGGTPFSQAVLLPVGVSPIQIFGTGTLSNVGPAIGNITVSY